MSDSKPTVSPGELVPEFHPLLPNFTLEEALHACSTVEGAAEYAKLLKNRKRRLELADETSPIGDPYNWGWELEHWAWADAELKWAKHGQYVAGGKRATKSERAAKRVVQSAMNLPYSRIWCFQGNTATSIATQQNVVWRYLPPEIKAMNGRARHGWAKIDFAIDRGFANNRLVLPNRSEIWFMFYGMEVKDYQSWEIGCKLTSADRKLIAETPWLENIGAWMDEVLPMDWLSTIEMRCTTRAAKWLWTFSVLDGITPAVRAVKGTPRLIKSAPAELLPQDRVLVPGCPPGHMPLIERNEVRGTSIVYFHTKLNPFPPNYERVAALMNGKPEVIVMRDAYGFGQNLKSVAHPNFGPWNIVPASRLPSVGTNYHLVDLAGRRLFSAIWVRVTPGDLPKFYVYRDWPSQQAYGEWATMDEDANPDGSPGKAQQSMGFGWDAYKNLWLAEEKIAPPLPMMRPGSRETLTPEAAQAAVQSMHADPYRQALMLAAWEAGEDLGDIREVVPDRLIDPRAATTPSTTAEGTTNAILEFAKENRNPSTGAMVAPCMLFRPAPGLHVDTGTVAINELLFWDTTSPMCAVVNEPRLFISSECKQVIAMLESYTGLGGEKGGWKDFHDLLRYMATADLCHVEPKTMQGRGPSGSL